MTLRERALELLNAAAAALDDERAHINDLNVYPVPDGDTGTNLFLTLQAMLDEAEASLDDLDDLETVLRAISKGSLMGARGNSGVILSQIVRGACESLTQTGTEGSAAWTAALAEASASAYRAVRQPVEGTMLTVMRRMAEAAATVPATASPAELLASVSSAGSDAVEETVEQLEVLRKAGVVDAGGYGLLVILRGGADALLGEVVGRRAVRTTAAEQAGEARAAARHIEGIPEDDLDAASKYRYCTSFLVTGKRLDREAVERFVSSQGDSTLVVGEARMLKVHVHTDHPGSVLSYASALGSLDAVEVADMREQTRARDRRLRLQRRTFVVAVAAGAGNKALFRELGCEAIVDGGQSMNPSAAQLVEAVESLDAAEVLILPNNANVVLTAEQAAEMCERTVAVVPSTTLPAGLAAMVAFDPEDDSATNAAVMQEAAARVHTAEITHAVRDSEIDGVAVGKGQVIGLVDGRLQASGDDLGEVFGAALRAFAAYEPEIVTVLTSLNGSGLGVADLEALAQEALPDVELEFHEGGQPLYPVLAGAE